LIPKHEQPKELNDKKYNKELVLFYGIQIHHYSVLKTPKEQIFDCMELKTLLAGIM
jgi:hypothetical protein